jgi:hypothetical protein
MTLAWLVVVFAPLITIIYFLATSKYRCPKCKSTFIGIKNKEGVYTHGTKAKRIIIILLCVFFGILFLGIMASIILVSLNGAREKAREAAFKAQASGLLPTLLLACDERNITPEDFRASGGAEYFDADGAYRSLEQDCGPGGTSTFSFSATGTDEYSEFSASCSSESGCDSHPSAPPQDASEGTSTRVNSLHDDLVEISAETNRSLPLVVDETIQLASTEVAGDTFTYLYKVNGSLDTAQPDWGSVLQSELVSGTCSASELKAVMERGAIIAYDYSYEDGGRKTFSVSPADCPNAH